MINFTCAKCGSKEYVTRKGKNHKGLYCLIFGKLDRYLTRGNTNRKNMGVKMREEWECPIDCKDRKIGCQNPNTCEVYKKRVERSEMLRSIKKVKPYGNIPRTTATRKGERKEFKSW